MRLAVLVVLAWSSPALAEDWTDVPALIAKATATIEPEVRACSTLPKRVAMVASRGKTGTQVGMPVLAVGIRGLTPEERCLGTAIAKLALPPLPAGVDRLELGHTFGAAPTDDPAFAAWRDLPATIATVADAKRRAALAACDRKPRTVRLVLDLRRGATRVWLPAWQFHAKSGDGSTPEPEQRVKTCLTRAIRGWQPPALPAAMGALELSLPVVP